VESEIEDGIMGGGVRFDFDLTVIQLGSKTGSVVGGRGRLIAWGVISEDRGVKGCAVRGGRGSDSEDDTDGVEGVESG
jgi:hypothetical protein